MTGCGWLWLYAGAFLMLLELILPGFVMFFFGLSAATVGLVRLGLGEAFSGTWQMIAFSAFSVVYILVLRRWLKGIFSGKTVEGETDFNNEFVGRCGKVTVAIEPPLSGRVEIGDAEWTAVADAPIAAGANVKVVVQENLTMRVEPL